MKLVYPTSKPFESFDVDPGEIEKWLEGKGFMYEYSLTGTTYDNGLTEHSDWYVNGNERVAIVYNQYGLEEFYISSTVMTEEFLSSLKKG